VQLPHSLLSGLPGAAEGAAPIESRRRKPLSARRPVRERPRRARSFVGPEPAPSSPSGRGAGTGLKETGRITFAGAGPRSVRPPFGSSLRFFCRLFVWFCVPGFSLSMFRFRVLVFLFRFDRLSPRLLLAATADGASTMTEERDSRRTLQITLAWGESHVPASPDTGELGVTTRHSPTCRC